MDEEITKLALECLKIDFETRKLNEERFILNAESNKITMETFKELIPTLPQLIADLVGSEGKFSSEMPPLGILSQIRDFTKFAKTVSTEVLGSLITDLQKIIDDRDVLL